MSLLALGLNHNTAPLAIREQVAFGPDNLRQALQTLHSEPEVREVAILSTCNRMELLCAGADQLTDNVVDWLHRFHQLKPGTLNPLLYSHPDERAVKHIMQVASGLDSMVLGEPQILGQVKQAYRSAGEAGTLGQSLQQLFQRTFRAAKKVRTDTAIGQSPVSVAFASIQLAKQVFADFDRHTALLVGAGETIDLAARHLRQIGIGRLIVANRTLSRAHALAQEHGGYGIALEELPKHLHEADMVIASTASPDTIIQTDMVQAAMQQRRHRPMLLIDLAVPRDIDARIEHLDDVFLYDMDHLQNIIQSNRQSREAAAEEAHDIIEQQCHNYMCWLQTQQSAQWVQNYRQHITDIQQSELLQALNHLQHGQDPETVLQQFSHRLTQKIMHQPSRSLRHIARQNDPDALHHALDIFGISPSSNEKH